MGLADRHYHREEGGGFGQFGGGPGRGGGWGPGGGGYSAVTWLIIVNAGVFLLDGILAGARRGGTLAPGGWGGFTIAEGIKGLELWRLVTYQFLHADFWHILFNMVVLYFFGPLMEKWWGTRRFVAFYLVCGCGGAILYTLFSMVPGLLAVGEGTRLVGASGSIFGILAACAVKYPEMRVMLLIPPIPLRMRTLALAILGIAAFSLLVGARNAGGEAAHLGGAALGWVLVRYPELLGWVERLGAGRLKELGTRVGAARAGRRRRQDKTQQAQVDRILAKVKEKGLASLTPREKKVLQDATDRASRR